MSSNNRPVADFVRDDAGAGLIEYALILSIVSVAAILAMAVMKDQLTSYFSNIGNTVGQYPGGP